MGNIGIFDSGVGGLTILRAVKRILKKENIIYVADQKHVPYAEKSDSFLKKRGKSITQFLLKKDCSTIIIACNTATVSAITYLRKTFSDVNFIGVEPAIKPAASIKGKGDILVLATKHTLQSHRLKLLADKYCGQNQIIKKDMPEWVELAEQGNVDSDTTKRKITNSLKKYLKVPIKAVVLACTHYPIFIEIISKSFPKVVIFDPSDPIANQAKNTHSKSNLSNPSTSFYTTGSSISFKEALSNLLQIEADIESIDI